MNSELFVLQSSRPFDPTDPIKNCRLDNTLKGSHVSAVECLNP